jgi:hypothetical protein
VDAEAKTGRDTSKWKGLISRNFAEPSDGLEPSTPPTMEGIKNPRSQPETSCNKQQRAAPSSSQLLRTTYAHRVF